MEIILNILSVVVSSVLAFVFAVWLLNIQKKKNREADKIEQEKREAEIEKLRAEAWQLVNADLRTEIDRHKSERVILINRVDELGMEIEAGRKREAFLKATIDGLKETITDLKQQMAGVKKTTDGLKDEVRSVKKTTDELTVKGNTDALKAQKRKPGQ